MKAIVISTSEEFHVLTYYFDNIMKARKKNHWNTR